MRGILRMARGAWLGAGLRWWGLAADAERLGMWGQGVDHQLDVLVQAHPEPLDAARDVLPLDLGGEALVLELLLDTRWRERVDPLGADETAGHDEAGQLVAGQERLV